MLSPFTGFPVPRWSRGAEAITYSSFNFGSLPGRTPATFLELTVRLESESDALIDTGREKCGSGFPESADFKIPSNVCPEPASSWLAFSGFQEAPNCKPG